MVTLPLYDLLERFPKRGSEFLSTSGFLSHCNITHTFESDVKKMIKRSSTLDVDGQTSLQKPPTLKTCISPGLVVWSIRNVFSMSYAYTLTGSCFIARFCSCCRSIQ